jgi:hypothetical protein
MEVILKIRDRMEGGIQPCHIRREAILSELWCVLGSIDNMSADSADLRRLSCSGLTGSIKKYSLLQDQV